MKKVYFVRHGESEVNAHVLSHVVDDREAKLTEKGKQQSRFIAERARKITFEVIISSPYVRTADTAKLIAEVSGHEIEYSELFTERRDPSSLTGMSYGDPSTNTLFRKWASTFYENNARIDDGENFADIKKRVQEALLYLERRKEENILVVSHGYFLRTLLAYIVFGDDLSPLSLRSFIGATKTDNTGVTLITNQAMPYDDVDPTIEKWRIRIFNDHAHLG